MAHRTIFHKIEDASYNARLEIVETYSNCALTVKLVSITITDHEADNAVSHYTPSSGIWDILVAGLKIDHKRLSAFIAAYDEREREG